MKTLNKKESIKRLGKSKKKKSPDRTAHQGDLTSEAFNNMLKDSLKQFTEKMKKLDPVCKAAQKEYDQIKVLEATLKNMEDAYENICEKEKEIKQISENLENVMNDYSKKR